MSNGKAALHVHADTSYLDGRAFPKELAEQAVANGDDAIALTDHDEVGGQLGFQEACKAAGVKDIKGTEARWLHNIAASREAKTKGSDSSHICLLAENNEGLRNMWILSSMAYEEKYFYQKPNLDPPLMRAHSKGLWASDGCGLTRFANYVDKGDEDLARAEWGVLLDIYGDHFYSELHTYQIIDPQTDKEKSLNAKMRAMNHAKVRFAQEMGVPLVIVNDAHYAQKQQWQEHRLVWKMNTYKGDQSQDGDEDKIINQAADWLMNVDEMAYWMVQHGISLPVIEEAMRNSAMIAESCNAEIKPHLHMPRLHATDEADTKAFLSACEEGFKARISGRGLDEEVYLARLDREVSLIVDKGMAGYFNVVADYVMRARDGSYRQWVTPGAKPTPCLCGPGRGSAGGSLVTYLMGITSLDPIKWDLMFERFINPDRPDFPDIDVDVQKSHRLGLKEYVSKRYGEDKVCAIGTRARSGPKMAIRDIAKAMGIEYTDINAMVNLVGEIDTIEDEDSEEVADPDYIPPTWDEVLQEMGGELAPYAKKHPGLFNNVKNMVGMARQFGVHAAAILINGNDEPLLGNVPTHRKPGGTGTLATQFDMHEIEFLGGVKDDLLSNKGLDVLAIARDLIYQRHGVWLDYDGLGHGVPEGCPPDKVVVFGDEQWNDPEIYVQVDRGQTAGIFQIHTPSGTKQAMRFKPRSLTDVADLAAINRPGVLRVPGLLEHYLRRRHGEEDVVYDHPLLEPITGPSSSMNTYGILVYQEQLIRCAREIAGFTPGDAEALRKAIGKKLMDKMKAMEPQFISGCMANEAFTGQGGTKQIAQRLWSSLLASGAYAFNKSHATGYAMQPVTELWVKRYYFDEFMVGCLVIHPEDKRLRFLRECRQRDRKILPPDINRSDARFSIEDEGLRFGFTDIKGIGDAPIPDIIANRPYTSMTDYLTRTKKGGGRKKGVIDALVKVGAFDDIGGGAWGRASLLEEVYDHRCGEEVAANKWSGLDLDARLAIIAEKRARVKIDKKTGKPIDEFPAFLPKKNQTLDQLVLETEVDLVGTFIAEDPMGRYAAMIDEVCIRHPLDMNDYQTGERFVVGGQITKLRTHTQKDARKMAFLTVTWRGEEFDVLAFADAWERCRAFLELEAPVALEVIKLAKRGGRSGCQLSHVERLDYILNDKQKAQAS